MFLLSQLPHWLFILWALLGMVLAIGHISKPLYEPKCNSPWKPSLGSCRLRNWPNSANPLIREMFIESLSHVNKMVYRTAIMLIKHISRQVVCLPISRKISSLSLHVLRHLNYLEKYGWIKLLSLTPTWTLTEKNHWEPGGLFLRRFPYSVVGQK